MQQGLYWFYMCKVLDIDKQLGSVLVESSLVIPFVLALIGILIDSLGIAYSLGSLQYIANKAANTTTLYKPAFDATPNEYAIQANNEVAGLLTSFNISTVQSKSTICNRDGLGSWIKIQLTHQIILNPFSRILLSSADGILDVDAKSENRLEDTVISEFLCTEGISLNINSTSGVTDEPTQL